MNQSTENQSRHRSSNRTEKDRAGRSRDRSRDPHAPLVTDRRESVVPVHDPVHKEVHTSEPVPAAVFAVRLAVVTDALAETRASGTVVVALATVEPRVPRADVGDINAAAVIAALNRSVLPTVFIVTARIVLLEQHMLDAHMLAPAAVIAAVLE